MGHLDLACIRINSLPEITLTGQHYRLPTEEEWGLACHTGRKRNECYEQDEIGDLIGDLIVYSDEELRTLADDLPKNDEKLRAFIVKTGPYPVGQKEPNEWGIYDLEGNVSEWTSNWKEDKDVGKIRGNSWEGNARILLQEDCNETEGCERINVGFRLAEDL